MFVNPKNCIFKWSIFIAVLLFPFFLFSQKTKTTYYKGYKNPTTIREAEYYRVTNYDAAGKPTGIVREYYFPHQLKWQGKLLSDSPWDIYDSICISYYENGKVQERKLFIDSLQEGNDSTFYESGKLDFLEHYKNGNTEGELIRYYESGKVEHKSFYVNGRNVGATIYYYENGKVSEKLNYVNGHKEGKCIWYYENGKLEIEENYHYDTLNGEYIQYYESGVVQRKQFYKMGNQINVEYDFYDAPNDTQSVHLYAKDGNFARTYSFYPGHKLNETYTYDSIADQWHDFKYYEDGKISSVNNKEPQNNYEEEFNYFENGHLSVVRHTKEGISTDTSWYQNGQIKMIGQYGIYGSIQWGISYDSTGVKMAENIPDSISLHIAKDNISCAYGLKDGKNNWVVNPQYAQIEYLGNGFYAMNENEKWGILNYYGKEISSPQYERVEWFASTRFCNETCGHSCGHNGWWDIDYKYNYGLFVVERNGKFGLINLNNKIIIPFEFNDITFVEGDRFYLAKEKPKPVVVDPPGYIHEKKIKFIEIDEGYKDDPDYLYGYGDTTGFFIEPKYPHHVNFWWHGLVMINGDTTHDENYFRHKNGLITYEGKDILPPVYDDISWGNNSFWATKNGKSGLFSENGKMLLDTVYHVNNPYASEYGYPGNSSFAFDSMAVVVLKHKSGIVGPDGSFILPLQYDSLNIVSPSCVIYEKDKRFGLLGKNKKPLSRHVYSSLEPLFIGQRTEDSDVDPNLILAKLNGKYGVINLRDSIIIPFEYDDFWFTSGYQEQIRMVKKDSLFSFNLFGTIHQRNPNLDYPFHYGMAEFSDYHNYNDYGENFVTGIINKQGKIILQPFYQIIYLGPDAIMFRDSMGRTGIMSPGGQPKMITSNYHSLKYDEQKHVKVITATGKVGMINLAGDLVLDTAFYFMDGEDEYFWLKTTKGIGSDSTKSFFSGHWGFADSTGRFILKPIWNWPSYFQNSLAILNDSTGTCLVKSDGEIMIASCDTILRDVNGFFIVKKNNKYGFADRKGNNIVEPKWKEVSGFLGNAMFCYDENGKTEVVDTTGKVISGGNFSSMMDCKVQLDSLVKFYERNYPLYSHVEYPVIEMEKEIKGYDLLQGIDSVKVKTAVENFLISTAALKDTSLEQMLYENGLDYPDYFYWDGKANVDTRPNKARYSNSRICVVDANSHTFSLVEDSSVCEPSHYMSDNCDEKTIFMNYAIRGDSMFPQTLEMLFDTSKDYKKFLNAIIYQRMSAMDNPDIRCSNPETYMQQIGEHFTLSSDSIVFYMPYYEWNSDKINIENCIRIPVSYREIKDYIKLDGALGSFIYQPPQKKKWKLQSHWPFISHKMQ